MREMGGGGRASPEAHSCAKRVHAWGTRLVEVATAVSAMVSPYKALDSSYCRNTLEAELLSKGVPMGKVHRTNQA